MSVYKRRDRGGTWWFRTEDSTGRRVNRLGGSTKGEAIRARDSFRQEQQSIRSQTPSTEFADFIATTYLPEQESNISERSRQRELGVINKHLLPFFAGALSGITPERITQYKNMRLAEVTGSCVRKELGILRHILRVAINMDRLAKNPFDKVKMPRENPSRVRYLSPEEWATLVTKIPEHYRPIATFLVNTGCRRSEALSLKWSNVDLQNGYALIEKDKRHREKIVPLNTGIIAMLQQLPRHEVRQEVFWQVPSGDAITWAFRMAVKQAGIVNFRLHDLRHTAASHLAMAGHDIKTIQEFLGHSDIRQTARYSHLATEHLKQASDSLAGKFS